MGLSRVFETITEIVGWIQIVFSLLFIGSFLGFIVYANYPTQIGMAIGIILAIAGLITGVIIATKKYMGKGTMHFISRASASPELDPKEEEEK